MVRATPSGSPVGVAGWRRLPISPSSAPRMPPADPIRRVQPVEVVLVVIGGWLLPISLAANLVTVKLRDGPNLSMTRSGLEWRHGHDLAGRRRPSALSPWRPATGPAGHGGGSAPGERTGR